MLRLYKDLGLASFADLEAAAKDDRIKKAKGLGAALQTKILQNLAIAKGGEGRLHMHRAAALLQHSCRSSSPTTTCTASCTATRTPPGGATGFLERRLYLHLHTHIHSKLIVWIAPIAAGQRNGLT
ncbi:hypothetical protein V1289_000445 [Bradyrhizobium sp. AZCC 2289]